MPNGQSRHLTIVPSHHRIGLVSTYPPKLCGLATFAAALEDGFTRAGHHVDIVRIVDRDDAPVVGRPVTAELINGNPASLQRAAVILSTCDVAVVQHEYGIYGGADGAEIIDLLDALRVPAIVVLHTVPLHPTTHQRELLGLIGDRADHLVVMANAARERLLALYRVDATKVVTIPHGAASPPDDARDPFTRITTSGRDGLTGVGDYHPQLLTWGLLGPGKGVEHVIDALVTLRDVRPSPRYTIAGVTHPKVLARDGNAYRESLIARAVTSGVADSVVFDDTYRNVSQLTRFVTSADIVVLPYDSRDQVTSGVLVDAIAAGRPVVATAFPHAVEMLGSGAGIVVPHGDAAALGDALRTVLGDAGLLASMAAEARRLAPTVSWPSVAARYVTLVDGLVRTREAVAI